MAITSYKRLTINVQPKNWDKYCELKREHLRNHGTPELSFSEYADLCMTISNPTLNDLKNHRKERRKK